MTKIRYLTLAASLAACLGCGNDTPAPGTGGSTATGGVVGGTGGASATGGVSSTGGSQATGGSPTSGGSQATGGSPTTGGSQATGGAIQDGGIRATGGSLSSGGTPATGGTTLTLTGGTPATGGTTQTATGGGPATGGKTPSGGTPSTGGTTPSGGTTATGGTGGSTSTGPCSAVPVSPNATAQSKNLLCFIYSQYGNHIISGQQETSWANPAGDISWYATNGLKYPAILGGDFLYPSGGSDTTEISGITRAIAYWNAGGISMFRYHQGMPVAGTTYKNDCYTGTNCAESTPPAGLLTAAVTAGTPENTAFLNRLNYMAYQIGVMKAANVPIILAIFHEVQPNGWFWWSKGTGAELVALWKYTFNYLTATKGLNNIIWLMPFSGLNSSSAAQFGAYFPGKDVVDLSGPDYQSDSATFAKVKSVVGATMPIPLHESSKLPDPATMFPSSAPFVLFNTWAGSQMNNTSISTAFNSTYTVTRDKVPSLK
jgi:hypothetical protein